MTAPEITREEAAADAALFPPGAEYEEGVVGRYARTVVALYDRMDALVRSTLPILENEAEAIPRERAMRECIARLRDGYRYEPWLDNGAPMWRHDKTRAAEPMTPAQVTVMEAR